MKELLVLTVTCNAISLQQNTPSYHALHELFDANCNDSNVYHGSLDGDVAITGDRNHDVEY